MEDTELEPGHVTRARQRRRALTTLVVVALGLFFAFWYAYSYYRHDTEQRGASRTATSSCASTAPVLRPRDVSVNVYNATDRNGIAAAAAKELRRRGFDVREVANDPKDSTVRQPAQVRYGSDVAAEARLVGRQVTGARLVHDPGRGDGTVDLVLGDGYRRIAPATPAPTPSCR